jgi:hypothetical protein
MMTVKELEQRVLELERQVKRLSDELVAAKEQPNKRWLASVRKFAGDEDLLSIFADAQKLREADRKKARQRPSAKRKSK